MDIKQLTPEQKAELFAQLEDEKKANEKKRQDDREVYKNLKDEAIKTTFDELQTVSDALLAAKTVVFNRFASLIDMKNDLFKVKADRVSDCFTTDDGRITVKLGSRVNEGWDDTLEIGVAKVKEYLKTLAKDDNSANLVDTVMSLLAKDRKGNLRANKVLELEKLAVKSGDADFIEGLDIIKKAYRPTPTCQFVEVRYKDNAGKEHSLPLSMSVIDL